MIVATPQHIQEMQIALKIVTENADGGSELVEKLRRLEALLSDVYVELSVYSQVHIINGNFLNQKGGTDGTNQGTEAGSNPASST